MKGFEQRCRDKVEDENLEFGPDHLETGQVTIMFSQCCDHHLNASAMNVLCCDLYFNRLGRVPEDGRKRIRENVQHFLCIYKDIPSTYEAHW